MAIFNFYDDEAFGHVVSVDTATVKVCVDDIAGLKGLLVNQLVVLYSSIPEQYLIGTIIRIIRKPSKLVSSAPYSEKLDELIPIESNLVEVALVGTLISRYGKEKNVFYRTLETVPEINTECFSLEGTNLTRFIRVISDIKIEGPKLALGKFTLDKNAIAYLNGNELFPRHVLIVGSTGSGKSWTTARLLDQIAELPQANVVLFDIHGEYKDLKSSAFKHFSIAGPSDIDSERSLDEGVLYLPYWLLEYEAIISIFVELSDGFAPNQSMIMTQAIKEAKEKALEYLLKNENKKNEIKKILNNFTIDSPIPFDLNKVLEKLKSKNVERVENRQGDFFNKLGRLIARLEAKCSDRRLAFLFQPPPECMKMDWLEKMAHIISAGKGAQKDAKGGIKIIDFSEVPSDILPLTVGLLARVIFLTGLWSEESKRHPIAIICDEAHLYMPEHMQAGSGDAVAVKNFERIAKEGRKYGIGLVVVSQRPSEVSRTVLSQCNNIIAMRLSNGSDQSVIKNLLPESLGSFVDLLPILDVGEALVIGDASLLPTRIRVDKPTMQPNSQTVKFWDHWNESVPKSDTKNAVRSWRRQSKK